VTIVARQSYDPSDQGDGTNVSKPIVKQWKTLDMDAIFLAGEVRPPASSSPKRGEQGLKVPNLRGDAMSSPAFDDGVRGAGGRHDRRRDLPPGCNHGPKSSVLPRPSRHAMGAPPDPGSAAGYDAVAAGGRHAAGALGGA